MSYKNPHYLIESSELMEKINDPNLRVFDTSVFLEASENGYSAESGRALYEKGHIPNAGFIDLTIEWSDTSGSLNFTIPQSDKLSEAIGQSGINKDHEVILYSSGNLMWATRAWWCLHFAGHKNIRVLNGSLSNWINQNLPIETGPRTYSPEIFVGEPNENVFSDTAQVESAEKNSVCVINALSRSLYEGTGDFYYARRGHIPESHLLFYGDLVKDDFFLPADELKVLLKEKGLDANKPIITYCGGGIAATIDAFVYKLLGYSHISVYDGSMSEWVQSESRPLTIGPNP